MTPGVRPVIDPFLGSGTTAVVAEQLKRQWKGCDLSAEFCGYAADRIELVEDWPVEKWLRYVNRMLKAENQFDEKSNLGRLAGKFGGQVGLQTIGRLCKILFGLVGVFGKQLVPAKVCAIIP